MTYILKPSGLRLLLPSGIANLLALALIYFGLRFDLGMLGFWDGLALIILFAIAALGVISIMSAITASRAQYVFNYNQITVMPENRSFPITQPEIRQDFLDRFFNTCSVLMQGGRLDAIPYDNRILGYLQQMAVYRNI